MLRSLRKKFPTSDHVESRPRTRDDGATDPAPEYNIAASNQQSKAHAALPSIVITAPPEADLPSYRVSLEASTPRLGPSVVITPPRGSLLPPFQIRHRLPTEHYAPEFPTPSREQWRPAEAPQRPRRGLRSYFWPPPNGDQTHPDSLLSMPVFKIPAKKPHHMYPNPPSDGSRPAFWFIPIARELPSIRTMLEHGEKKPVSVDVSRPVMQHSCLLTSDCLTACPETCVLAA
jgi:hypothetical protein